MSDNSHIKKSVYNEGRHGLRVVAFTETKVTDLTKDEYRLRKAIEDCDILITSHHGCSREYFIAEYKVPNGYPDSESCPRLLKVLDDILSVPANLHYYKKYFDAISLYRSLSFHKGSANERIAAINDEIRALRLELKKKCSIETIQQIRKLVQELHSIISFYLSEQRKYVKRLRMSLCGSTVRDIRKTFRQTIQIIFKNLPDFSGCEEEAKFTNIVDFKPLFLFNNQKHHVQYKVLT
jgi:hypothetical protein